MVDFDWVEIPQGAYRIGGEDVDGNPEDAEGPVREVQLGTYRIAASTVTNAQFQAFVKDTGYVTDAERIGWTFVFHSLASTQVALKSRRQLAEAPWWLAVKGANWRWPAGRGSILQTRATIPLFRSRGTMPRPIVLGPAQDFRPRQNGKWRRVADQTVCAIRGEMNFRQKDGNFATFGRANFRTRILLKMAFMARARFAAFPPMVLVFTKLPATFGSGARSGSQRLSSHGRAGTQRVPILAMPR